jgi:large subunit ribosomal protein L40e
MPVALDPEKMEIVTRHKFGYKVCRKCGARNPPDAEKCRRCRSKNLRPKKFKRK